MSASQDAPGNSHEHRMGALEPRFAARDYWPQVQHIIKADIGSVWDLAMRWLIVACAGCALYYATQRPVFLSWALAYLATNALYCWALTRMRGPVALWGYLRIVALNIVTSSTYAFMPIYLWVTMENPSLKALALCGIIGHAMFNLARHNRMTLVSYWDAFSIIASGIVIGVVQIMNTPILAEKIVIGVGLIGVLGYYIYAQLTAVTDREALARSRDETLEAQKQATMGQITAGVAHDFNNKLTVIQGNIELAALTHDPAERTALLQEARQAGTRAAMVVAHMQAFVRKSPLRISAIDLTAFGKAFRHKLSDYLPESHEFSLQIDGSVSHMQTDPALLETALLNLVLNASQAMADMSGRIELRIAPGDLTNWSGKTPAARGPFLRFDVADEGSGLPVQDFQRVQEPFYSSKPIGQGTGLGLSMVKGFTEQIGGAMMLRNRASGGLEVSLILPQVLVE